LGNLAKTLAAPATIIVATDYAFYERMTRLFPAFAGARDLFAGNEDLVATTAYRNATLQGGYLIMAIRAVGLDAGPMSGFDNVKVDEAFFSGTKVKSNFLINIGYGDASKVFPRGPRPDFSEDCCIL
jgi:3-hydroxypropanoate dehydrogenase